MRVLTLLLSILILVSCNEHHEEEKAIAESENTMDVQAELASIEKTRQAFMSAVKVSDFETVGKIVTPDFKNVSPGSSDWQEMYETSKKQGPFPYDSIIMYPQETVIVSDSVAYDFGSSKVYYTNSEGNAVELRDSFLAILKKDKNGVWRLHREVASSNMPMK